METEQDRPPYPRLWEVDTVRGIAIVLMIAYHLFFDLAFFGVPVGDMDSLPWKVVARSIGTTFILVMGVSLTLRHHRLRRDLVPLEVFVVYLKRGATLFVYGMVVTVVTFVLLRHRFVIFGILHLLGLSAILAFPFLRSRWASLAGGVVALGLGLVLSTVKVQGSWFLWLGVPQAARSMVDYYPILPWFGFALLGMFLGMTLYPRGARRFGLPDLSHTAPIRGLTFLGKHSLLIYLVHQPILIGLLILVGIGSL